MADPNNINTVTKDVRDIEFKRAKKDHEKKQREEKEWKDNPEALFIKSALTTEDNTKANNAKVHNRLIQQHGKHIFSQSRTWQQSCCTTKNICYCACTCICSYIRHSSEARIVSRWHPSQFSYSGATFRKELYYLYPNKAGYDIDEIQTIHHKSVKNYEWQHLPAPNGGCCACKGDPIRRMIRDRYNIQAGTCNNDCGDYLYERCCYEVAIQQEYLELNYWNSKNLQDLIPKQQQQQHKRKNKTKEKNKKTQGEKKDKAKIVPLHQSVLPIPSAPNEEIMEA